MNRILFFISVLLIFSIGGCKSTKDLALNSSSKKVEKILEELKQKEVSYDWLNAKADIKIQTSDLNQSAKLYLRMRNDSLIWGSITYLFGIEVARFFIDKEQITFIDKIKGQYFQYPISFLEHKFAIPDIDFSFIENLVLGNVVYDIPKKYESQLTEQNLVLSQLEHELSKKIIINPMTAYVSMYEIEKNGQKVELTYFERIEDSGVSIPANVEIILYLPEKNSFTLNFNSLQLNKPVSLSTSIPKGYDKVE